MKEIKGKSTLKIKQSEAKVEMAELEAKVLFEYMESQRQSLLKAIHEKIESIDKVDVLDEVQKIIEGKLTDIGQGSVVVSENNDDNRSETKP